MGWRMHSHRLVMGVALLAGLVMIVGYLLLSGVPSSFLLSGALVQTSDVTTIVVDAGHGGYASVYGDGARGFEIYADPDDAEMWAMASAVEEQLAALDFSEDRGVKDAWDSQLYVICRNPIPSLLVEMGFISDSQDIDYILSHSRLLADAIAQGIIDSLEAK